MESGESNENVEYIEDDSWRIRLLCGLVLFYIAMAFLPIVIKLVYHSNGILKLRVIPPYVALLLVALLIIKLAIPEKDVHFFYLPLFVLFFTVIVHYFAVPHATYSELVTWVVMLLSLALCILLIVIAWIIFPNKIKRLREWYIN